MGDTSKGQVRSIQVVLHLTQSQIATDPRILRAMEWGNRAGFCVRGIGVRDETVPLPATGSGLLDLQWKFRSTLFGKIVGSLVLGFRMFAQAIRTRPDVIHCHQFYVLPVAVLVSCVLRAPIVYDAHELESLSDSRGKIWGSVVRKLEHTCSYRMIAIVTVCEEISEWYKEQFPELRVVEIYNVPAVDVSRHASAIEKEVVATRGQFDLEVLYIGRTGASRETRRLLNLQCKGGTSIRMSFLGWSPSPLPSERGESGSENTRYLGAADHRDVVQIARHFDVGVVFLDLTSLSYQNALPNKFWELVYSGVPVLASRSKAIESVAVDFPNVMLVDELPETVDDWYGVIRSAANLGKRAVADVPDRYGQDEMIRRLEFIYGSCARSQ